MVFSLQQRIVIVEAYLRTGSIKETQQAFLEKYPEIKAPAKCSVQNCVKKWRETGSVENVKKQRPKVIRTPKVVSDIQQRISRSPQKSTQRLSQQVDLSRTTCQRVLKSLSMRAYRITCVQELKLPDKDKRLQYCRWLLSMVEEERLNPLLYFISDEAWFHLSGYMNSQNTRYWSSENPHVIHETPLHDLKIGVWCAVSGTKIVGAIIFASTVNTDVYLHILEQFNDQLTPQDKMQFFFQQDGATCYTSYRSLSRVHDMFTEERTNKQRVMTTTFPGLVIM